MIVRLAIWYYRSISWIRLDRDIEEEEQTYSLDVLFVGEFGAIVTYDSAEKAKETTEIVSIAKPLLNICVYFQC